MHSAPRIRIDLGNDAPRGRNITGRCNINPKDQVAPNDLQMYQEHPSQTMIDPTQGLVDPAIVELHPEYKRSSQPPLPIYTSTPPDSLTAMKNPISVLSEYATKNGLGFPIFEELAEEGPSHMRTFTIKAKLFGMEDVGVGKTKKLAKAVAARRLYTRIRCREKGIDYKPEEDDTTPSTAPKIESTPADELSEKLEKVIVTDTSQQPIQMANIVQQLQNLCRINNYGVPEYDFVGCTGEAHNPEYTIRCSIKGVESVVEGKGRSKALAKREAALAMWNFLEDKDSADLVKKQITPKKQQIENPADLKAKVQFFELIESDFTRIVTQVEASVAKKADKSVILNTVAEQLGIIVRYSPLNADNEASNGQINHRYIIELVAKDGNEILLSSFGRSVADQDALQLAAKRALEMLAVVAKKSNDLHSD